MNTGDSFHMKHWLELILLLIVPLTLGAGHAAVRLSAGGASPRLYEGSVRHFEAGKVLGRTAMETHPAVALFNSGYQAVTGKDAIDYHELSTSERVWSGVGAGLEVAGKAVKVAASVGTAVATVKAVEGANDASRAIKATKVATDADKLQRAGKKLSEMTVAERRAHFLKKGIPESAIGPSGYPKLHVVRHASLKEAKDAARAEVGKGGSVIKHPSPEMGVGHFHGVSQKGEKSRIHHEYPK